MLRRILITGGGGYIGDSVVEQILNGTQLSPYVLDDLVYGGSYMRGVRFIRADITDSDKMSEILREGKHDVIIHLAALVGDGACAIDPERARQVNVEATKFLVDHCKENDTRFIFASTCSVYGANNELLDENSKTNPLSVYAETKLEAEEYIRQNLDNYVIFRLGTLFGLSTEHARVRCDLVANVLTYKAAQGDVLEVHGGEQWRPLLHVCDAAKAFYYAIFQSEWRPNFKTGTYVLCGQNYKIIDLAKDIIEVVGEGEIKTTPRAFEDLRNYKVDSSKALNTGWRPQKTLKNGVADMVRVILEGRISDVWSPEFHNAKYMRGKYGTKT